MNDKLLNEMRNGAFRLAIESKIPVVAISMINAGNFFHLTKLEYGQVNASTTCQHLLKRASNIRPCGYTERKCERRNFKQLKKHYPQGKYPIEFDPKDYTESVYLNTHKETE